MKKKFFISLFIIAAICLLIFIFVLFKYKTNSYQPQQNLQAPIEIPDESIVTIQEAKNIDKPVVAMFYVDWCGYCRRFMPVFGEFAKKYKNDYTFAVINCDKPENINIVKEFHIMGFPTLFIIDNKINHKFTLNMAGTAEKSIMKEELDNYLKVRKNIIK